MGPPQEVGKGRFVSDGVVRQRHQDQGALAIARIEALGRFFIESRFFARLLELYREVKHVTWRGSSPSIPSLRRLSDFILGGGLNDPRASTQQESNPTVAKFGQKTRHVAIYWLAPDRFTGADIAGHCDGHDALVQGSTVESD